MIILGISAFYHDSAAALIKDGEIIAAAQEERFSRLKGDSSFPNMAIQYCLSEARISIDDVNHIVFYDKPIIKFERILSSYIHRAPWGLLSFIKAIPIWLKKKLWVEDLIKKELKYKHDIFFTEHHQSHAASVFFPSPFKNAAIITLDGAGEWKTTTIGIGEQNLIKILKKIEFPHSLGLLYSAFTLYCGFRVNSGEYKLMGLAPYGEPKYVELIKNEMIKINNDGSFILNEKYFNYISGLRMISRKFEKIFGKPALKANGKMEQFYMDIAASIQRLFDEILVLIAKYAQKITHSKFLCIAGGVGLNCVSNSKILLEAGYEDVWIQPAAGDAGGALGAALYVYYNYLGNIRKVNGKNDSQKNSYLGPAYSEKQILEIIQRYNAVYKKVKKLELIKTIASEIKDQKIVAWFQGRMEFGPRALGNRSILADPRSETMQSVMNLKIKFRESFRPEKMDKYFDFSKPSPYMLFVAPIKKDKRLKINNDGQYGKELLKMKRSILPAITHVDYSARLQTVSKNNNPLFYDLIKEFERITECPILINTSFNVRGEPIVCSPEDAYLSFMGTNIDILVMGSYILYKSEQSQNREGLKKWKKSLIKD